MNYLSLFRQTTLFSDFLLISYSLAQEVKLLWELIKARINNHNNPPDQLIILPLLGAELGLDETDNLVTRARALENAYHDVSYQFEQHRVCILALPALLTELYRPDFGEEMSVLRTASTCLFFSAIAGVTFATYKITRLINDENAMNEDRIRRYNNYGPFGLVID